MTQTPVAFVVLVHILGLIGMAGVQRVPVLAWEIIAARRIGPFPLTRHWPHVALGGAVLCAIGFALFIAIDSLPRVFHCLWIGNACSATKGGALFALSLFGVAIVILELSYRTARGIMAQLARKHGAGPERFYLSCANCGRRLTKDVRLGDVWEWAPAVDDEKSPVAEGVVVRLPKEDASDIRGWNGAVIGRKIFSPAGAFSVNPLDIFLKSLVSCGRDAGCCGSSGLDGPNRACVCGEVLGTEWSDCRTQAEVRLHPDAVVLIPLTESSSSDSG